MTTYRISPLMDRTDGSDTYYYYFAGRRIAVRSSAGLSYLYADNLGSTMVTTGTALSDERYTPWGTARDLTQQAAVPYRYTGQREEAALGLYDYGARWYDPNIGRFIQADTIVPQPGNPQSLNRYSYALNNPMRYTDPTGHHPASENYKNDSAWYRGFFDIYHTLASAGDWGRDEAVFSNFGPFGAGVPWSQEGYATYYALRNDIGDKQLAQIGSTRDLELSSVGAAAIIGYSALSAISLGRIKLPEATALAGNVYGVNVPFLPNIDGIALGRYILSLDRNPDDEVNTPWFMHEGMHVLQQSAESDFLNRYIQEGIANWPPLSTDGCPDSSARYNQYETQAYRVEYYYRNYPWLPKLWDLPR